MNNLKDEFIKFLDRFTVKEMILYSIYFSILFGFIFGLIIGLYAQAKYDSKIIDDTTKLNGKIHILKTVDNKYYEIKEFNLTKCSLSIDSCLNDLNISSLNILKNGSE